MHGEEVTIRTVASKDQGVVQMHSAQENIYFDDLRKANSTYTLGFHSEARETCSIETLSQAIQLLAAHADIFKISIDQQHGIPQQTFSKALAPRVIEKSFDAQLEFDQWAQEHCNRRVGSTSISDGVFALVQVDGSRYLFTCVHHLFLDGYGCFLLHEWVHRIAVQLGEAPKAVDQMLASIPSFRECIEHQDSYMHNECCTKDRVYWDGFAKANAVTRLPRYYTSDETRPQGLVQVDLSPEMVNKVNGFCDGSNVRFAALFEALTAIYFQRTIFDLEGDVVLQTVSHGRPRGNRAIGMASNPLFMRCPVRGSFESTMEAIMANMKECFEHRQFPVSHVARLNPDFANPDIVVNVLPSPVGHENQVIRTPTLFISQEEEYGFHLNVYGWTSGNISLSLSYSQDCFLENEANAVLERLVYMATQVLENQFLAIDDIQLVNGQEHDLVASYAMGPVESYDRRAAHDIFEDQVRMLPDEIALVYDDLDLTFQELNECANELAHKLIELDCGKFVGMYLDRGLETVISMFAIMKAGAAYVPISPEYPADRTQFIIEDTCMKVLLTHGHYFDQFTSVNVQLVDVQEDFGSYPSDDLFSGVTVDDFSYVLYTSGTTGRPKGVIATHRNIAHLVHHKNRSFFEGVDDVVPAVLGFAAYTFDACVMETMCSLLNGYPLIICTPDERRNPSMLEDLIQRQEVTFAFFNPKFAEALPLSTLRGLRTLWVGGEATSMAAALEMSTVCNVANLYGPTECTVYATQHIFQTGDVLNTNIGRPITNMETFVVDKTGHLAPVGVVGELLIGGAGVASGYINRPDLTDEKFVKTRFLSQQFGMVYRTGDQVRWLPNGELEFLGRIDQQVKIRGFRIELGEVESALLTVDGVIQAVAVATRGAIDAYVVTMDSVTGANQILTQAAKILPDYMVPSTVTFIEFVPTTVNGKVDFRALPAIEDDVSQKTGTPYVAPGTVLESQLCEIWCRVLGKKQVGINDSFFQLGGTSIDAIKVVGVIREELSLVVTVSDIFDLKTVGSIALKTGGESACTSVELIPRAGPGSAVDKLSFGQERCLFIESLANGTNAYHIPFGFVLAQDICMEALENAINFMIERHHVLRTVYNPDMTQSVLSEWVFSIETVDLEQVSAFANVPFELSHSLPLRACVYEDSDSVARLLVVIHHIAFDGWSVEIFLNELALAYESYSKEQSPELESMQIQYSDFAVWERDVIEDSTEAIGYWTAQLTGYENLNLLTDKPRPSQQDYAGANVDCILPSTFANALRELAQSEETTLFSVLISAWYLVLNKTCNQQDLIIGTPTANRQHPQTHGLIGYFVNTLALRVLVDQECSVADFIAEVNGTVQDAKEYEQLPFDQIVDALGIERDQSRNAVFQVLFGYNQQSETSFPFGELSTTEDSEWSPAKFDLTFNILDDGNTLNLSMNYATSLFNESSVNRMLERYRFVLEQMVSSFDVKVKDISILMPEERGLIMNTFSVGEKLDVFTDSQTSHGLFEARVQTQPNAVAVVYEGVRLTYAELNMRANALARKLVDLDCGKMVGLCLDRSLEMVISMLAVQKAGGAYVPISPEYPAERTKFIIEDTGMSVIITHGEFVSRFQNVQVVVANEIGDFPTDNLDVEVSETDLAYVIYTSGTTGNPKGVMLTHKNLANYARSHCEMFLSNGPKIQLAFASYTFDVSVMEVFGGLLNGQTVVVASELQKKDPTLLAKLLHEEHVDWAQIPPKLLEAIPPATVARLNTITVGGESCNLKTMEEMAATKMMVNLYGPTEATINSTWHVFKSGDANNNIGRPLYNAYAYVVDAFGDLAPVGVPGELVVGGTCVAVGYLNRPELTSEKFIANPFDAAACPRLYKTGDVCRWLENGDIEFLGRNDFQIKLNGFRIELQEIENVISAIDGVQLGVVVVHEKKYLDAYVIASPEQVSAEQIQEELAKQLPEYMIPSTITFMEELPYTIAGKMDMRALPLPDRAGAQKGETFVAPTSDLEKDLCAIWQRALGAEAIGVTDDFFRSGGTSLTAIRIQAEMNVAFGCDVSLKSMFEAKTIRKLIQTVCGDVVDVDDEASKVDLKADVQAFSDNASSSECKWEQKTSEVVLLTGATGLLGAYILYQLVTRDNLPKRVHCIVRASNNESAEARLVKKLKECGLHFEGVLDRVTAWAGDIAEETSMGLAAEDYEKLAKTVDTVIHSAAYVNHMLEYEHHRATNVVGTKNIIDFCKAETEKRLAHVSSTSVNPTINRLVKETESIDEFDEVITNGYCQSKWVAEQIVQRAGIPAIIFRPGEMGCDSTRKHFWSKTDALRLCLQMCFDIGSYPVEFRDRLIEFTPADLAAKSIVCVVDSADLDKKLTVNVSNPKQGVTFKEFFQGLGIEESCTWYESICKLEGQDEELANIRMYYDFFLNSDAFKSMVQPGATFPKHLHCNELLLSMLPESVVDEYEQGVSELLLKHLTTYKK
eukprot:CAMPEP_0203744840 /NCGR_PEP_ID=MMETSP0098-20131031/768_1 /ASSEMBLY_ACC=CAM_ASM_000208 /TAXON_ID=96639 /ORGANISM=" , Strain NY0313808BC1" /LENGTH=2448 /DNA_ID=CAMNT_0050632463 /DNA_START=603 /DNA_END=7949 /DNA_ORIENTATION=+